MSTETVHHYRRPFVMADIGPDGRPQAMLVTPSTETVVDQDTARSLIAELLLVLAPGAVGGGIAAALLWLTSSSAQALTHALSAGIAS